MRFLIFADDMTGTLDAGVCFAQVGARVDFCFQEEELAAALRRGEAEVFLLDTETRHLSGEEAYRILFHLTTTAMEYGVDMIFKKTDSGMRGNIGEELTAVMDASEGKIMHFLPAYPQLGRTTRNGIQYVDHVAVARSVYGRDPFEPVTESSVLRLAATGKKRTYPGRIWDGEEEGIVVWDAGSKEELCAATIRILESLKETSKTPVLWAGCGGLAGTLARVLPFEGNYEQTGVRGGRLFIVCGSVSPVSEAQTLAAVRKGLRRRTITEEELGVKRVGEDAEWLSQKVREICGEALEWYRGGSPCMLDTGFQVWDCGSGSRDLQRKRISCRLGTCAAYLAEAEPAARLMIIGGDTLMEFMTAMNFESVHLLGEISPGVVSIGTQKNGIEREILTKSGSFGDVELLSRMINQEETI